MEIKVLPYFLFKNDHWIELLGSSDDLKDDLLIKFRILLVLIVDIKVAGNQFPEIEQTRCHSESPMESGEFKQDTLAHVAS